MAGCVPRESPPPPALHSKVDPVETRNIPQPHWNRDRIRERAVKATRDVVVRTLSESRKQFLKSLQN